MLKKEGRKYELGRLEAALAEFTFGGGIIHKGSRTLYLGTGKPERLLGVNHVPFGKTIARIRWRRFTWKVILYSEDTAYKTLITEDMDQVVDMVLPWARKLMQL